MEQWEFLNRIYEPLYLEAKKGLKHIQSLGFKGKLSFYNLHETKENQAFHTEFFPLPEIEIDGIGDLGIKLDSSWWLELTIDKAKALELNFEYLCHKYDVEIYGVTDYQHDFYDKDLSWNEIKEKLAISLETKIHLCFTFKTIADIDLVGLLRNFNRIYHH